MKRTGFGRLTGSIAAVVMAAGVLSGCNQSNEVVQERGNTEVTAERDSSVENLENDNTTAAAKNNRQELEVRFGDEGEPFMMHLYDNDTAAAIAGHVGTSDWRLPIYERDDVDYSVLQYYDIPSRYEIPSNPEAVTSQKAGEVYYSHPNRIVLFYKDAQVEGEFTLIGYFDATEEFTAAVEENPVLEGWGNKILQIAQP